MATSIITRTDGTVALRLDGWDLSDENSTTTLTPADLAAGFETPAQMLEFEAGLTYALDRWAQGLADPSDYPDSVARYESCQPPHPECYVLVFADGSAYVRSNARDEVWADFGDYLSHVDCTVEGETIVAD